MHKPEKKCRDNNGEITFETEKVIVSYRDDHGDEYDDNCDDDDDDDFVVITTNQLKKSTHITPHRGMKYLPKVQAPCQKKMPPSKITNCHRTTLSGSTYSINGVCVQWIHLAKLRIQRRDLVNTEMNLPVQQQNMDNLWNSSKTKNVSRRTLFRCRICHAM
jgi:hypothetical protein